MSCGSCAAESTSAPSTPGSRMQSWFTTRIHGAVPRAIAALWPLPKPRFVPERTTSTRAKASRHGAMRASSLATVAVSGLLSWTRRLRRNPGAGSARLSTRREKSAGSGRYVTTLMSTSAIANLHQHACEPARQHPEGAPLALQLHVLLGKAAARFHLPPQLLGEARDIALQLGAPRLRILGVPAGLDAFAVHLGERGAHLHHLVGEPHQLLAEKRSVEVRCQEARELRRIARGGRAGVDAVAVVERVEGAGHLFEGRHARRIAGGEPRFY